MVSLDHFEKATWLDVYEPSDDSFLFVDAFEKEKNFIISRLKAKVILEIGFEKWIF